MLRPTTRGRYVQIAVAARGEDALACLRVRDGSAVGERVSRERADDGQRQRDRPREVSPHPGHRTPTQRGFVSRPDRFRAPRFLDHLLRLGAVAEAARFRLLLLQILVDLEEVLDLVAKLWRDVVDVVDAHPGRVAKRHEDDLLVAALLVGHVEDADDARADAATGEGRLADEDERVERVAVLTERTFDEAVVRGIAHRGEEPPVEDDVAGRRIDLVLVARAHRHLDEDGRLHRASLRPSLYCSAAVTGDCATTHGRASFGSGERRAPATTSGRSRSGSAIGAWRGGGGPARSTSS